MRKPDFAYVSGRLSPRHSWPNFWPLTYIREQRGIAEKSVERKQFYTTNLSSGILPLIHLSEIISAPLWKSLVKIFPRFHCKNVCKILKSNGRNFVPLLPTIPKIESIIFFFLKRNKIENYRNNKLSRFIISPKIKFSQIYTYNPNSGWNKSKIKKN